MLSGWHLFWKYTQHINTIQCMRIWDCLGIMQPLQETHVNQNQWRQWTARLGEMFLWVRKFHVYYEIPNKNCTNPRNSRHFQNEFPFGFRGLLFGYKWFLVPTGHAIFPEATQVITVVQPRCRDCSWAQLLTCIGLQRLYYVLSKLYLFLNVIYIYIVS